MDEWLSNNLVCPRDKKELRALGDTLVCSSWHVYPIIDDVPIMLLNDVEHTLWVADTSIKVSTEHDHHSHSNNYYIETLGISPEEKEAVMEDLAHHTNIDPVVKFIIAATSGYLYKLLIGKLNTYPIPDLRLPQGNGKVLLDIGCNWGRWCVAAGRKGYMPVGIDPSIGAVMAARRISADLGITSRYVVADARYLPFATDSLDVVFSYSVLQHFSKANVRMTLEEVARVLKKSGVSFIQMPNTYGLRSLYHQLKRRFREAEGFEVRYWRPAELKNIFTKLIGNSSLSAEGYFGLGIQKSDAKLLPLKYRLIIEASEGLRILSRKAPFMVYFADSIYVESLTDS
jgi:SAM-dependent methyltransferase/uncharacterized protein YbaR (Trm112 family)